MMDWLDELKQIRDDDSRKRQEEIKALDLSVLGRQDVARQILKHSEAHNLLRRVNGALLANRGVIETLETSKYDCAIALVWQGRISEAQKPIKDGSSSNPHYYIAVSTKGKSLYVNHKELAGFTPEHLRLALVEAAKNPLSTTPKKPNSPNKK